MRGEEAERLAAATLIASGLRLRERNFRCRGGEIDLIMEDGGTLVFVEVRLRTHGAYGSGAESVDARKRGRLVRCAQAYLQQLGPGWTGPCRFDVMAIDSLDPPRPQWIKNAFGQD